MQVKKQQLEPDMEQWTSSKLGKEYVRTVYCRPAYLISVQSTSCDMPGWMKHKLESRLPGEISITSLVAQTVKCLPELWETQFRSLGWEDPLEKEMATHSHTLALKIPWMEEPGGLQSMGSQSQT